MRILQPGIYHERPGAVPGNRISEIKEYLAGNLCRCSGYEGQLRGIQAFLEWKKEKNGKEAAEA